MKNVHWGKVYNPNLDVRSSDLFTQFLTYKPSIVLWGIYSMVVKLFHEIVFSVCIKLSLHVTVHFGADFSIPVRRGHINKI